MRVAADDALEHREQRAAPPRLQGPGDHEQARPGSEGDGDRVEFGPSDPEGNQVRGGRWSEGLPTDRPGEPPDRSWQSLGVHARPDPVERRVVVDPIEFRQADLHARAASGERSARRSERDFRGTESELQQVVLGGLALTEQQTGRNQTGLTQPEVDRLADRHDHVDSDRRPVLEQRVELLEWSPEIHLLGGLAE